MEISNHNKLYQLPYNFLTYNKSYFVICGVNFSDFKINVPNVSYSIDDNYIQEVGRLSSIRGRKLEEILDSYVGILMEIETEAITSGEISQAVSAFRECVTMLNDRLSTISTNIDTVADSFIIDINTADDYLF